MGVCGYGASILVVSGRPQSAAARSKRGCGAAEPRVDEVKAGPCGRRGCGASAPAEEVGQGLWLKACPLACPAAVQNGGTTTVAAWQRTGQGEHDGKGTTGVRRLGCLLTGWARGRRRDAVASRSRGDAGLCRAARDRRCSCSGYRPGGSPRGSVASGFGRRPPPPS